MEVAEEGEWGWVQGPVPQVLGSGCAVNEVYHDVDQLLSYKITLFTLYRYTGHLPPNHLL